MPYGKPDERKTVVTQRKVAISPFKDIKIVKKNYLQRLERLVIAEQTNFVEIIQSNGEPPGDFITRLREAAHICQFEELEVAANSEAYFIQLRLFRQNYEHKAEILGYLQS